MKFLWLILLVKDILCLYTHKSLLKGLPENNLSAVQHLQEYIRIDSSKTENYDLVVEFWQRLADEISLPLRVYRPEGFPVCVLTWIGAKPDLPSIMLNTHSDVVPAYDNLWKYPPFAAVIDDNGDLYGRGAQDTKSLAIQHFEAIKELKNNNITLQRTIHITVLPDEEVGGFRGIKAFIKSGDFKRLNVGFVLDEGLTSPDNTYLATYMDRRPWQINMTFYGQGGHGSEIAEKGVIEKLDYILNCILQYQKEQKEVMARGNNARLGRFTSMNVNIVKTGIATNILPSLVNVVIDMRLATDVSISDIQQMIDTWQNVTGPGKTVEYLRRDEVSPATTLENNRYWNAMLEAAAEMNITLKPVVLTATSDMVVVRKLGIPAIGFNPSINTISRVHNNDEYVNIETFIQGIQVVKNIVMKLSNVPE
ncbi:aminoacylase-1A [Pieris rapae]|uniref:aminoacylase-1A n=1 Tax=Pieris rapae TaxID=64459 RepID=UPI001E27E4F0|nr:aminoacylase-1A [Pieris rapae]